MARVKGGTVTRKRRKRILKLAKGYRGAKHIQFKVAKDQVMKSYLYAFRDRRRRKSDFRRLWLPGSTRQPGSTTSATVN